MATAAAIAAAAATAVAAGASVASSAGAFGGGAPGQPKFKQVPKRPFESAQQKYMSRVMMANLNNRGPTYEDWLKSGGTAHFELTNTGMTPFEAERLGFVGPGGKAPAFVDPETVGQTGLTRPQWQYSAQERGPETKGRMGKLGRLTTRIDRLSNLEQQQEGGLRPGQQARLDRLRKRQTRLGAGFQGSGE